MQSVLFAELASYAPLHYILVTAGMIGVAVAVWGPEFICVWDLFPHAAAG